MPELDNDLLLHDAFADLRTQVLADAPRQDISGVRAIARRRRNSRAAVVTGAAALVLAVPVAAYAMANQVGLDRSAVPGGTRSGAADAPANAGPTPSTSSTPPSSPAPGSGAGISQADIESAGLTLPPWPARASTCARKITREPILYGPGVKAVQTYGIRPVDYDRDGKGDAVAMYTCLGSYVQGGGPGGNDTQVVAFRRDAAGKVVVAAQVLTTWDGAVKSIVNLESSGADKLRAEVGSWYCCGNPAEQRQWREYGWDGSRFGQTGGPTAFPADATQPKTIDLVPTAADLKFSAPVNGRRTGTLTVTVVNKGPASVAQVKLLFAMHRFATRDAAGKLLDAPWRENCTATGSTEYDAMACTFGGVAAGKTATYKITFVTSTKAPGYVVGSALDADGVDPAGVVETARADNRTDFSVTLG